MNSVSVPVPPPTQTTASRLVAFNYSSNLAQSWPPSAYPTSLDRSLQVYLQYRTITVSEIEDHSLQLYLQTRSITASECISQFARSWPRSGSPNLLDGGLQVHLETRSIPACKCISQHAPLCLASSHNYRLQVHLQTQSIMV